MDWNQSTQKLLSLKKKKFKNSQDTGKIASNGLPN
jgi:hypothetical protein